MRKLYEKYLKLKMEDKNKFYLFACGNFYIFLEADAVKMSEIFAWKRTPFAKGVEKCGFPKNSLEKYRNQFENYHLSVEVIEEKEETHEKNYEKEVIETLKHLKIYKMTPMEALNTLEQIQKKLHGEKTL